MCISRKYIYITFMSVIILWFSEIAGFTGRRFCDARMWVHECVRACVRARVSVQCPHLRSQNVRYSRCTPTSAYASACTLRVEHRASRDAYDKSTIPQYRYSGNNTKYWNRVCVLVIFQYPFSRKSFSNLSLQILYTIGFFF